MPRCSIRATARKKRSAPIDRHPRSQQQSTARFSRRPPERRVFHAPKLFHRPGVFERRQASLRLDRLHHRPHRPEAKEHRQRHRGLQIRGRTNHSRALHQDTAPAHSRRQRGSVRPAQNSRRNRNPIPRRPSRLARGKQRNGATGVLARHGERSTAGGQQSFRQCGASRRHLRADSEVVRPKPQKSLCIPAAYPYTVIANKAGTKAWVSLWNASASCRIESGDWQGRARG